MMRDLFEMAELLAGSQTDPEWCDRHQEEWESLNSRLREMFSPNDYMAAIDDNSSLREEFERDSVNAAVELSSNIQQFVESGDMESALCVARYFRSTMMEELGPQHEASLEAQFILCQLLYQTGDLDGARDAAASGIVNTEASKNKHDQLLATFHQLRGNVEYDLGEYLSSLEQHATAIRIFQSRTTPGTELIDSLLGIGKSERALGRFADARNHLVLALNLRVELFPVDSLPVAEVLGEVGAVCAELCDYDRSIEHLNRALEIRRQHLPASRDGMAISLYNLARASELDGRMSESQAAWDELEDYLDPSHPHFYSIESKAIKALLDQERIDEAHTRLRRITLPAARQFSTRHPRFAELCENWGKVYLKQGQLDAAYRAFQRTLAIRKETMGESTPEYAIALVGLARVKSAKGERTDATDLLDRAQTTIESSLGSNHPAYGEIQALLGEIALALGDYDAAYERFKEQVLNRQVTAGQDHPNTIVAKSNLGVAAFHRGDLRSAEALFFESLEGSTAAFGQEHRYTTAIAANLSATYFRQGRPEDALIILDGVRDVAPARPGQHVRLLNNLACIQVSTGEPAKAIMTLRTARQIAEDLYGVDHFLCGIFMQNEAACLADSGQHDKAKSLCTTAIDILTKSLGADHPETQVAQQNLHQAMDESSAVKPARTILTLLAA